MKGLNIFFAGILAIAGLSSQAQQDDDVFNRVNGVKFENKLYLRWNENSKSDDTKWECRKDNDCKDCANWHSLEDLDYFNVRNGYNNDYKIVLQFYNPLKYSMKSAATDVADPTYSAINEFISKLPNVKMDDIPKFDAVKKIGGPEVSFGGKTHEQRKSPIGNALLYDWTARLQLIVGDTTGKAFKGSKEKFATLMEHLAHMKEIEDYLYGEIRIDSLNQAYTLQMWLKQMANDLYKANDYSEFERAIKRAKYIDSHLVETKKRSTENFDKIIEVLSEQYDNYFPYLITETIGDWNKQLEKKTSYNQIFRYNIAREFKEYTSSTVRNIVVTTSPKFEKNHEDLESFEKVLQRLSTFSDKFGGDDCGPNCPQCGDIGKKGDVGYAVDYMSRLNWRSQKMEKFQYSIARIKTDGSIDDKTDDCEFTVAKRLTFYSFISTGALYTGFSYPNYSLRGDTLVHTGDTKVKVRPAVYLNMLLTSFDPIYPFAQIGLTTGVNDVMFPIGAGISIQRLFSISGGAMIGYKKDISDLQRGQTGVTQAMFDKDFTNKADVSWYLSINYNLTK